MRGVIGSLFLLIGILLFAALFVLGLWGIFELMQLWMNDCAAAGRPLPNCSSVVICFWMVALSLANVGVLYFGLEYSTKWINKRFDA